jgi:hypothetical protein
MPPVEYVTCKICKSPDTLLSKENRLDFVTCEACGSSEFPTACFCRLLMIQDDQYRPSRLVTRPRSGSVSRLLKAVFASSVAVAVRRAEELMPTVLYASIS